MTHGRSFISRTRFTAVAFVLAGGLLSADDSASSADGSKIVPVTVGGKTLPIRVRQQADPLAHANFTDELDPQRVFSSTSSMADKTFALPANSFSKGADFNNRAQNTFITKPYLGDTSSSTVPNLNAKPALRAAQGYDRSAAGFDKSYATSSSDVGPGRMAVLDSSNVSADQHRVADLGGPDKPEPLAMNSMADKSYVGPGAQNVPDNIVIKDNIIISRMSGLPSRPLSIGEVRDLINHGVKPNTDVKPEETSKPLNDPDYKPEPLRDMPPPSKSDDDNEDVVPPPGTMAAPPAPENSEPLPQP